MSNNNKWEALSMKDRAFLIRQAVKNGITDIDSIRDTWEHRFDGNSDTINGGEIPAITITPEKWQKEFDEFSKKNPEIRELIDENWVLPDRRRRSKEMELQFDRDFLEGNMDYDEYKKHYSRQKNRSNRFPVYYDTSSDHIYKRVLDVYKAAGEPRIHTGEGRAYYRKRIIGKDSIHNISTVKDFIAELAHPIEGTGIITWIKDLPKTLKGELTRSYEHYEDPNHFEYKTHKIVEPSLRNYILEGGHTPYIHEYSGENDGWLDKERIVRNIPAREFGPYTLDDDYNKVYRKGTTFWKAPLQYLSNKQLGKQNEDLARQIIADLENTQSKEDYNIVLDPRYHSYEDAIHYLDHVEGLRKYLGLPYNTNTIKESEYKPTRLQGTNEQTYKFASSEAPGYWDEVVDDMVNYGRKKKQYIDETLNEFTAYRDRDEKGDFVSIYDEWDYNPRVRGGNKKLNKVIDLPTGGKGFIVYDRIYLDDHYNIPKEGRGGVYIDPIVVTPDNSHQFSGNQPNLEYMFKSSYPSTTISEKADYQVISTPLKYTYPEKNLNRQLDKKATVQDFSDLMYPIIQQELAKNNYPMDNIDNTMRQIALESNYGRDTRGNGFNYAGIKVQGKDKKKLGTKHSDGFYYRNFDNNAHFADWYLDLLNNRYDALNATSKKDYINRLHDGKYKYSANKKAYKRSFYRMSSLENALNITKKQVDKK